MYLAGAQLLFSHGWRSALPALTGVIASGIYHSGILGLCGATPPAAIRRGLRGGKSPRASLVPRSDGLRWHPVVFFLFLSLQGSFTTATDAHRKRESDEAIPRSTTTTRGSLVRGTVGRLLGEPRQRQPIVRMRRQTDGGGPTGNGGHRGGHPGARERADGPLAAPSGPPSPGAIETLTSMGFDEGEARRALVAGNNNLQIATDILLERSAQ